MEKVSAQKMLYMFADYKDWLVCPFFMLALYRICGNGQGYITNPVECVVGMTQKISALYLNTPMPFLIWCPQLAGHYRIIHAPRTNASNQDLCF